MLVRVYVSDSFCVVQAAVRTRVYSRIRPIRSYRNKPKD